MGNAYYPRSNWREDKYLVSVKDYAFYHKEGYVIIRGLLAGEALEEIYAYTEEKRIESRRRAEAMPKQDGEPDYLTVMFDEQVRVHMLSRTEPVAERTLLNPRILDVAEALVGPDVYALQDMFFMNPPGMGGQGWHQDSCYIKTHPDTLLGAWVALEPVDEENGCLWIVPGSHNEPVYPPKEVGGGRVHAQEAFADLDYVHNVSHPDDEINTLSKVAAENYPPPIPVPLQPGDVLFFHSHLFHRSHANASKDRYRRSCVLHYCNARSYIPWDHDGYEGDAGNYKQILARGRTHMPYASPIFGTPVQLNEDGDSEAAPVTMMGMDNGMMMPVAVRKGGE
ncbi:phytanoyl-CoA dioxygenase family protein [Paenibacillus sacheonensis]|uniref:Phytanoyl-CoA dioxygenase family protein n=1 Tax=Paenibacillus sacheonensis TaxID=742054 RepID=A0A7X5C300_9BACL|nr:phytanoyl-CoA dioxygenase family protein [Paenibacillus sacheonensis]MBM7567180.1 ectoine hydroxylase-related dioxygenase (phytanoyl-CoA dioxygenase family) [Paenibacillus sacheonensis]NBC70894.1 phytanoyl-CoA dioxygenase family protein [Paenibacillus sacheonensis]